MIADAAARASISGDSIVVTPGSSVAQKTMAMTMAARSPGFFGNEATAMPAIAKAPDAISVQ